MPLCERRAGRIEIAGLRWFDGAGRGPVAIKRYPDCGVLRQLCASATITCFGHRRPGSLQGRRPATGPTPAALVGEAALFAGQGDTARCRKTPGEAGFVTVGWDPRRSVLHLRPILRLRSARSGKGHEERLPPGRLRVCYGSDSSRSRRVPSVRF